MGKYLIIMSVLLFLSCGIEDKEQSNKIYKQKEEVSVIRIPNINKVYNNYQEAFEVAKEENKSVFILFTTEYCRWCIKLKETTLQDINILKHLNDEFVVLLLNKRHSQYPSKYQVKAVPAVYITDKNEEIFTSIVGYHKNPIDYIKWFNYIQIELSNE